MLPAPEPKKPLSSKSRILTLGEVAQHDPRLAAALLQAPGMVGEGGTIWATGGWELLDVDATFNDVTANQSVSGDSSGIVETDLWVRSLKYTVERPLAFAGSIFKAQSDYFNSLNPNITLQLIVNSYCRYFISPDFTPLQNIIESFECDCPAGLVFSCGGSIDATFSNRRALAADEVPTIVTLTFSAIRLPPGLYSSCSYGAAVEMLRARGYLEPAE